MKWGVDRCLDTSARSSIAAQMEHREIDFLRAKLTATLLVAQDIGKIST